MNNGIRIEEATHNRNLEGAKIKVIGVGGGGGNMINHMIREGIDQDKPIDLISLNTDVQALNSSLAHLKIQLGPKLTKGLGAGMKPDTGRDAALESFDTIKESIEGADIVFIAAGLGGGTGTGAAPIVAQAAKEMDALTVAVVTKPFKFEGRKRGDLALRGLEELKEYSDSIVVIPNDKLLAIIEQKLGIKESFTLVDDILSRAVNGMSSIILDHGQSDINVDFADVKTIMSHRGLALMGVGEAQGAKAASEALQDAIESPLFDNMTIDGAMGVLVHFYIHPNYPLADISEAMDKIEESVHEEAQVIFSTTTDENLDASMVKVTIVATGFEHQEELIQQSKNNSQHSLKKSDSQVPTLNTKLGRKSKVEVENVKKSTTKTKISMPTNDDELDLPSYLRLGKK